MAWAGAGRSWWAGRPAGPKGKEVPLFFSFFFFKPFPIQTFSFQIQTKFFQTFHKNFINFLEVTQATKSYAKSNNDAQPLVVSILIKLSLIF
jgi:hypothetical protein